MELPTPCGLVTLTSDFGLKDPYVGLMHGAVRLRHPRADVVDLTHGIAAHDVRAGALVVAAAIGRFPKGSIHVAVVDPGVGSDRRALAVCAHDVYWIGPDNGLFTLVLERAGARAEVRALDVAALRLPVPSRTFWGRDVFAPVAGLLSARKFGFRALGPRAPAVERIAMPEPGAPEVTLVDAFGNLITSVTAAQAAAAGATAVEIAGRTVPLRGTYSEAEPGALLALVNSYDLLEVAVCEGRASDVLGVGIGEPVALRSVDG